MKVKPTGGKQIQNPLTQGNLLLSEWLVMAVANAISATSNTIGTRVLKGVPSFLSSLTSRVEPNQFLFFASLPIPLQLYAQRSPVIKVCLLWRYLSSEPDIIVHLHVQVHEGSTNHSTNAAQKQKRQIFGKHWFLWFCSCGIPEPCEKHWKTMTYCRENGRRVWSYFCALQLSCWHSAGFQEFWGFTRLDGTPFNSKLWDIWALPCHASCG